MPATLKMLLVLPNRLVNNLKPEALTSDFAKTKADWMKSLGEAKSLKNIGDLTSKLVKGLKPAALTKEFSAGKSSFLSALKLLK